MQLHGHTRFAGSAGCIIVYISGALIIHDPLPNLSAGVSICVQFSTWYVGCACYILITY